MRTRTVYRFLAGFILKNVCLFTALQQLVYLGARERVLSPPIKPPKEKNVLKCQKVSHLKNFSSAAIGISGSQKRKKLNLFSKNPFLTQNYIKNVIFRTYLHLSQIFPFDLSILLENCLMFKYMFTKHFLMQLKSYLYFPITHKQHEESLPTEEFLIRPWIRI